jgi:hypothetical protein
MLTSYWRVCLSAATGRLSGHAAGWIEPFEAMVLQSLHRGQGYLDLT